MIVLQIIGIILAVIIVLIVAVLSLRVKPMLSFDTENGIRFRVKVLCFTFGNKKKKPEPTAEAEPDAPKKKEKKPSRFVQKLKKKFGLDFLGDDGLKHNVEETGISDTVTKIVTIITLLLGQIKWLLSKFRLEKLRIFAVCSGGDAADAAMDYGAVCAAVYPLVGYIMGNINAKKNAEEVRIGCDFDGNTHFEFDLFVSVRIIYLVRAVLRSLTEMADVAQRTMNEEEKNEQ